MIQSFKILNPERLAVRWWHQSDTLKAVTSMAFSPGLNVLWGRNGSGKSSVLKLLARWFHAETGGRSVITHESCRALVDFHFDGEDKWRTGVELIHDGQPVFYANPAEAVGIVGGQFDDDFFTEGFHNTMFRGSSGQTTLVRVNSVAKHAKTQTEIEDRLKNASGSPWKETHEKALELLTPNCPTGPRTFLLDEPERSMDFDMQSVMWTRLQEASRVRQVIVATHSVFALNIAGAKYLELTPGYLDACRRTIAGIGGQHG